jgi:O-antigen/teichoic acid export membrane protein
MDYVRGDEQGSVSVPASGDTARASTAQEATRKQIRGSSLLLIGRFLSLGVNFGIQIMIVRYLSKADYGAFAYALSIVSVGASIVSFGLDRSITRFIPIYEEDGEFDKLWGTIVMVVGTILSLSFAIVLLVYGLEGWLTGTLVSDRQAVSLLLIMIFLTPIQALDGLLVGMFAVFSKPRAIFFRRNVLAPALRLTVVLLLVLGEAGVEFLAAGYVAAGAVGIALYTFMLFRTLRQNGLIDRFRIGQVKIPAREVFGFTVPLLASDLLFVTVHTSDVLLLGHYRGSVEVAEFRVVWPAAQLNQIVMGSFTLLFTPVAARLFARKDYKGISDLYWQTALWIAVLSFPIFALTFSLAQPLTSTLFGVRYEDSATYLTLLSLAYYFNAALGFNGLTLKVFGKVRFIVVISILAAIVNIGLNLLLIPRYGALGAAIGTASTLIAHNVMKQVGLRMGTGISLFQRRDAPVYLSIAAGAGILLIVHALFTPPFVVGLVLAAVISLAVLALNRSALRAAHTFPELTRFRLFRIIVGK